MWHPVGINRRTMVMLAGAAGVVVGVPRLMQWAAPLPETRPLRSLPGFTVMRSGAVTGGSAALAGLNSAAAPPEATIAAIRADPAAALFDAPQDDTETEAVPIAVFTDVNCPNCRVISATLVNWLMEGRSDIAVTFHELPLLGPSSVTAARVALAAGLQGGYLPVHHRLMQGRFRPSPAFIRTLADEAGLDADRIQSDMFSPKVEAKLRHAKALAYVLGVPGTPATVIDRTLVIGALSDRNLSRLIRRAKGGLAIEA